jgi:hypothetical protein
MPTTNHSQSLSSIQSPTIGRVNVDSLREKLILNNMTRMMVKLTPDSQTKVMSPLHEEIPVIRLDGHLTYCLYITIQNLIHLNVIHILLYHTIFWLNSTESDNEIVHLTKNLENTKYEQTLFLVIENNCYDIIRSTVNVHLINKYVYITLIGVSTIELISAFLWTLQKKLDFSTQQTPKPQNRLKFLFIGIIVILYFTFIAWLFFHTFITHYLTLRIFLAVVIHFTLLTLLDKPNLFCDISIHSCKGLFSTLNLTRKQHRPSPPRFLKSSSITINRLSHRSSTSTPSQKVNSLFSSFRWSSVSEQNLDMPEYSTPYANIRQDADNLWPIVVRRMALKFYRTFASFIFFDLMPYKMMGKCCCITVA